MKRYITEDTAQDGIDRRGFLTCMAWAGTGMLWSMAGGVPGSLSFGDIAGGGALSANALFFVQSSDNHMGFNKAANPDVAATFQEAIRRINALPAQPAF